MYIHIMINLFYKPTHLNVKIILSMHNSMNSLTRHCNLMRHQDPIRVIQLRLTPRHI
jgi:hypothetical protein